MPVVDSSVLIEVLVGGDKATRAYSAVRAGQHALCAPHLVDAEVGHVLRRLVALGALPPGTARQALGDLVGLNLQRIPHASLLARAWELRANLSFYDALYVALAELRAMPLITFDARLARARGVRAEIEVLA